MYMGLPTCKATQAFVLKWYLPLAFAVAITVGLALPGPGTYVSSWKLYGYRGLRTLNVCSVFVISGLCLDTAQVRRALGREGKQAFAFGVAMILGVTPLAGFAAVRLPFRVEEFSYGMAIFCAVPTTIAVGVAMVTQAEGNVALALLLTVCTNLLGVGVVPFWLKAFLSSADVSIDAVALLVKLVITVLVPLLLGQWTRLLVPPVRGWVAEHRTLLKLASNTSLALIVWQTISSSAHALLAVPGGDLAAVIGAGASLHLLYLLATYVPARYLLQLKQNELKAVVFMSSVKSAPVAIAVIAYLSDLGSEGLVAIPAIATQQAQLFIDSFIATRWAEKRAGASGPDTAAMGDGTNAEDNDEEDGTSALLLKRLQLDEPAERAPS